MQFKKKIIAGALAAGLVMGAGGIAAAYLTTTGSGSGSATVTGATPVTFTVTTTSATLTAATKVAFTYTNPNAYKVKLNTPVSVMAVTQTSAAGTCFAGVTDGASLLGAGKVTTTPAPTAIGTVAASASTVAATSTQEPTITLHTTASTTQVNCTFSVTLSS